MPLRTRLSALGLTLLLGAMPAVAQDTEITFPSVTAEEPTAIGFVSLLTEEERAELAAALDAADTEGFFPEKVEARGTDPARMILYLLPSWDSAQGIPPEALPPAAAEVIADLPRSFFRYALPMRRGDGEQMALVFYIAPRVGEAVFNCLAEDLVEVIKSEFSSTTGSDCSQR